MGKKYKMYYRVYQDINNMDGLFYVDTKKGVESMLIVCIENGDIFFPVIEPTMMTEEEFNKLPEFKGY